MAAGPVAALPGTDVERHANAVAGVEARAAHLGALPVPPEVPAAPLRAGFEAAASENDAVAFQTPPVASGFDVDSGDPAISRRQRQRARSVANADAVTLAGGEQRAHQPRTTVLDLQGEAAPEAVAPIDLERLAAVQRHEANSLITHPAQGGATAAHQQVHHAGIGAAAGDTMHVLAKLSLWVGAEVGGRELVFTELRSDLEQLLDASVGEAHCAHGEVAVAAVLTSSTALEHGDRGAGL